MLAQVIALALAAAPPPAAPAHAPLSRGVRITEAQPDAPSAPPAEPAATPAPPAPAACQRLKADLAYAEAPGFDQGLRRLLAADAASVVVDTPEFGAEAPPTRLAPWLGEVQRTGGAVNRQDIPCARSRGFSLMKLLGKLFTPRTEPLYGPAKAYDVTLWTEKSSGMVKQVQFIRRPA